MLIATTRNELLSILKSDDYKEKEIGFVPTMGALHQGHISLIEKAVKDNERVVASIFVNPSQFNDPDDLKNYPRTPDDDLNLLRESGCDLVFHPSPEEVYDETEPVVPDPGYMASVMEGASRPGHFKGVMMVVRRLLDLVSPKRAYFGEKDYQQLAILRFMVDQLDIPVEVIGCATIRENDGLAMSSRNVFLSTEERKQASTIYQSLKHAALTFRNHDATEAGNQFIAAVERTGLFKVDYLQIADSSTLALEEVYRDNTEYRIFTAVRCSRTRLIDNIPV